MTLRNRPLVTALLGLVLAVGPAAGQQATERPRPTAEELHEARRLWLEQQRLGDSASLWTPARGARGPLPRAQSSQVFDVAPMLPPAYAPLGLPHGFDVRLLCAARLTGAPWLSPGMQPFGVTAQCVPAPPAHLLPPAFGHGARPLPDPAYPRFNRHYHRFFPPEASGLYPDYGAGMHILPPDPWRPPPWYWGMMPLACAQLSVVGLSGAATLQVPLPSLGARTAEELEILIDARLSQGLPVQLQSLDGRVLRLAPGVELERLSATSCEALPRF